MGLSIVVSAFVVASLCDGIGIGIGVEAGRGRSGSFRVSGGESRFRNGSLGWGALLAERLGERRLGGRTVDLGSWWLG